MSYIQQYENLTDNFNIDDKFKSNEWNKDWGNADINNQNYIDWITYNIRQIPEYKDCEYSFKDNNDFAITPKENTFTNENQNDIDILKENSQCDYDNNVVNECCISEENNNMTQLSNIFINENDIKAEDPSDLYNTLSLKENLEKQEKIRKKRKELNRQELLLQNEKQELELKIKKEQEYVEFRKQSEQQDNTMNKNNSNEPKNTDEEEPQNDIINEKEEPLDNMRNVKQKEHASEKLYSRNPNYEQYNKEHYDKDLEDLIEEANNRLWGKDKKKYRKEECQIKEQEKFTIDEEPTDNMRNIKNNKTLEINEYEKGCFNISYT